MDNISDRRTLTTSPMKRTTYSDLGKCIYSAIYQTNFRGNKRIKKFPVSSPQDCFRACYLEGCRSSNLLQIDNQTNSCELFRDALIDYRTADVLVYDSGSVYFDGIICTAKRRKEDKNSSSENDLDKIDNEDYADNDNNE
ncbi:hypothetical protein LOAG_10882 [Loa loa]|nr:hypothetical protein LOAG_10882 [Loa loa]EFO17618.1 hypothetical protein LOAG_10882 [Loa loa]